MKALQVAGGDELNKHDAQQATGNLVPPRDPDRLAAGIVALFNDDRLRSQLGENAVEDARVRFDLRLQVDAYSRWYEALAEGWRSERPVPQPGCKAGGTSALSSAG